MDAPHAVETYDAVVIGGGAAGAATALLLLRRRPGARVLIVESTTRHGRKVGEATVEVSGHFLSHVLGLWDHLSRRHLPKHGLRYWFQSRGDEGLAGATEIGPARVPRLPSFQLDRAVLDEHLLARARAAGAHLARPWRVAEVENGWPRSELELHAHGGGRRRVRARWVLDASGRHTFLARRMGLLQPNREHPTHAAWARFRGVRDLDDRELAQRHGLPPVHAARRLATNHFCGRGHWAWVIPLPDGTTSVGLVWDERHFSLPGDGRLRERFEGFLRSRADLAQLLEGAHVDGDDFHARRGLAYCSARFADRGWVLVGDAGAFLDPFYSPGLDSAAFAASATAALVARDLAGELPGPALTAAVAEHDAAFRRSYARMFDGLYRDKYELFGDAELTRAAFLLDTSLYYLGVVGPLHRDEEELLNPVLSLEVWQARLAARTLAALNRRLVRLARRRVERGTYGRRNAGWRALGADFGTGLELVKPLALGIAAWISAELHDLFGGRGAPREPAPSSAAPAPAERLEGA